MTDRGQGPLMQASPFLVFAVTVEQAGEQLASASYVPEWVGVGRRTPLFDAPRLREFMSSPWRRFFLAELLASYTPRSQWVGAGCHPPRLPAPALFRAGPGPPGRLARRGAGHRKAGRLAPAR